MKRTKTLLALNVAGLLAFEFWTFVNRDKDDTISESVWDVLRTNPVIGFFAGVLCGHFFWQRYNGPPVDSILD